MTPVQGEPRIFGEATELADSDKRNCFEALSTWLTVTAFSLRYVLITSRTNHWDRVGNVSSFPYEMLRGAVMNPERLADHTPAVFVKVDKEMRTPEKTWEGEVTKITRRADKVWLEFRLGRVTKCPENFAGSPDGWYTDGTN